MAKQKPTDIAKTAVGYRVSVCVLDDDLPEDLAESYGRASRRPMRSRPPYDS